MSIVALKRKTGTLIKNLSVGEQNFSINGTRRNQGYIGQNVISRYTNRTLARGNTVRGSGGCCGRYEVKPSILSGLVDYNDDNIVKKSNLGTMGQIMTQYAWIRRPAPYTSVKPDSGLNNNTQSTYIDNLTKQTIKAASSTYCNLNYGSGLLYTIYDGYFNNNTNYTSTLFGGVSYPNSITNISSLNSFSEIDTYYVANSYYPRVTMSIVGYFYIPKGYAGTWTFTITSGPAAYMWINEKAVSGYTIYNALIAYDGSTIGAANYSNTIDLEEDTYYPIRILGGTYGSGDLGDVFSFKFTPPNRSETTNGNPYLFNNSTTTLENIDYEKTTSNSLNDCIKKYNGTTYFRPYTNNYNNKYSSICTTSKDLTQIRTKGIAMSQGDYMSILRKRCGDNDIFNFGRMNCGLPLVGS